MTMRLSDWQTRLTRFLATAARAGFAPGRMDCALLAAGAVEAQTGVDLAAEWRGAYDSIPGGLRAVRASGYQDHVDVFARHLTAVPAAEARPGDIAVLPMGRPLPSLGVVHGTHAYVLIEGQTGLLLLPMTEASLAFQVGA